MCDDYFETHDSDDLMEWEEEQVFQDGVLEREDDDYDLPCTDRGLLVQLIKAIEDWNWKTNLAETEMDMVVADAELYNRMIEIKEIM